MLSAGDESVIVQISIVVGLVAIALVLFFILLAIGLRGRITRQRRWKQAVEERWLPLMLEALREPADDVPDLRRREQSVVLAVWNRLVGSLTGEGVQRLRAFARNAGLPDAAHRLVGRGRPAERLVATTFLGYQRDLRASKILREMAQRSDPILRAEAARALVRLDPVNGPRAVAPIVMEWDDHHPATAVAVLAEAPDDAVADALGAQVFETEDPARRTRLLEILGTVRSPKAAEVARRLLPRTIEPELIARCLEILGENRRPQDAVLVRRFLRHPTPFVRLRAVATLTRLQVPGDEWRILSRVDDPDWWVRQRVAEATVQSRHLGRPFIELLARIHPDRYARGALDHALTEWRS